MRTTTTAVLAVGATALAIPTTAAHAQVSSVRAPLGRAPDRRATDAGAHTELAQQRLTRKAWRLAARLADARDRGFSPRAYRRRVNDDSPAALAGRVRRAATRTALRPPRRAAPRHAGRRPPPPRSRRSPPANPAATPAPTPATGSTASTSSRSRPGRAWAAAATPPPPARPSRTGARRCSMRARAPRPGRSAAVRVSAPMALRDEFPVLERVAYLNAGTDGPIPRAAAELAQRRARARSSRTGGRGRTSSAGSALQAELRAGYARLLGLRRGGRRGHERDELRPRLRARRDGPRPGRRDRHLRQRASGPARAADRRPPPRRDGRAVPFAELAEAVTATTTLVAASHVNWITGEIAPGRAGRGQRAGDPRRRAGRRRGAGRRQGARLRRLRRRGPEVAVRRRRDRDAVRRPRVRRAGAHDRAHLLLLRGRLARPGLGAAGGRAALRRPRCRARRSRSPSPRCEVLEADGLDAILERAADLADDVRRARSPRRPHGRAARAQHARRVRVPGTRRPRRDAARGGRRRASATCPGTRTCGPRWAPGTTSPTSSACSPRCSESGLRLLRVELGADPVYPRRRSSSRGRSRHAGCGWSTAALTSA